MTEETDTDIGEVSDLSVPQEMTLVVLQICASVLSLIGSTTIVYKIVRNLSAKKVTTPYERIILGLSSCDILSSITFAISPFLLPSDSSQRIVAIGSDATCQTMGFMLQFSSIWAIWYNCILSFYYLLTVRFRVKRSVFCRKYELWFHLSGILFFPVTASTGYFAKWYGEQALTMTCWVRAGNHAELVSYIYGAIPMLVTFLALVINNIVIYAFVRRKLISAPIQSKHFTTEPFEIENDDEHVHVHETTETNNNPHHETTQPARNNSNKQNNRNGIVVETEDFAELASIQRQLAKEAATQGFLYVFSFLLTATPVFVIQVLDGSFGLEENDQGSIYWLLVMNAMLMPLQGFFNVFIYVRPAYSRFAAVYPDKSRWFVLKQSLFDPNIPKLTSIAGGSSCNLSTRDNANKQQQQHRSQQKERRGSRFSMSLDNIDEQEIEDTKSIVDIL